MNILENFYKLKKNDGTLLIDLKHKYNGVMITNLLTQIKEFFELTNLSYLEVPRTAESLPTSVYYTTCPEQWKHTYLTERFYEIDPGFYEPFLMNRPVDWTELGRYNSSSQTLFDAAARHGVGRFGLVIPMRGPLSQRAIFSLTKSCSFED